MINQEKWIETLPGTREKDFESKKYEADPIKWTNTIPTKKHNNKIKKISFLIAFFIIGVISVSVIKNKTRSLQKEIDDLRASISSLESNFYKASLDYEVITSPQNIAALAKKHLDDELIFYKKSQIQEMNKENKINNKLESNTENKEKNKINLKIAKKIEEKKKELEKLKELYNKPQAIPGEVRKTISQKITIKKEELKNLYENPKEVITAKKIQQWGAIQFVKLVLGVPVIPGK